MIVDLGLFSLQIRIRPSVDLLTPNVLLLPAENVTVPCVPVLQRAKDTRISRIKIDGYAVIVRALYYASS